MENWHNVHITDKNGKAHFNTTASPMSVISEIRNLKRHLQQAKNNPRMYHFLDVDTAVVMLDGEVFGDVPKLTDNELLTLLNEL